MALEAVHIASGSYQNKAETDRRLLRRIVGNQAGQWTGMTLTPKVGSLGVDIAAGEAIVTGRSTTSQGFYYVTDSAVASIVWPAPSAQPRIDALVLAVGDTQYGALGAGMGGTVGPKWIVVQGTPSGTPSAPIDATIQTAVGAGGWERIANVAVNPGDTALVAGDFTTVWTYILGWNTYTPTATGVTLSPGPVARYYRRDSTVTVTGAITLGGTPTGEVLISLPPGLPDLGYFSYGPFMPRGVARGLRTGVAYYDGTILLASFTAFKIGNAAGVGWGNNSQPAVWASGDSWGFTFTYETSVV
jgi:hypothetical protein